MKPEARDKNAKREPIVEDNTAPLQIEPDEDEERDEHWSWRPAKHPAPDFIRPANMHDRNSSNETIVDEVDLSAADQESHDGAIGSEAGHMSDILHWAIDSMHDPALTAADWLARDIDHEQPTAAALLSNPKITMAQIKQAKSVFKTMRVVGEKSSDRRVGARMYAASIAAALVRHGKLISRQSEEALRRGLKGLLDDHRMPGPLRDLAGMGLCALADKQYEVDGKAARKTRTPTPLVDPPLLRDNRHNKRDQHGNR
jgi:hypothetical protein